MPSPIARRTIALPTLLAVFAFVAATPAAARTLKIATISPDGTGWMTDLRAGGAEIAERTEGRVKLKFYPGGVMGNEKSMLRKMRLGQLHGGAFGGGGLVEVYNDMQVYSIPFVFRSFEEVDYVRERMDPLLVAGLEERGLVAMGISETGFAHLFSVRPLRTREDLRGRKMWIPEGDVMSQVALETGGVSPVPLPIPDVYTGLQTGLIDTFASPPIGAIAFQWHTKVRYVTDLPLMYLIASVVIDKKAFDRLAPGDREIVREVFGRLNAKADAETRAGNREAMGALAGQGIERVDPSAEETERWREIVSDVLDDYRRRDLYSQEMYEKLRGHLDDYRNAGAP